MIVRLCASALFLAICALILRELGFRGAPIFAIFAFLFLLGFATEYLESFGELGNRLRELGGAAEGIEAILKIVGVGCVAGITADICSDIGEKTISKGVIAVGRVEILAIALPFFIKIIDYSLELIL